MEEVARNLLDVEIVAEWDSLLNLFHEVARKLLDVEIVAELDSLGFSTEYILQHYLFFEADEICGLIW